MKGDIIKRLPMHLGLRLGNPGKNGQRPFLRSGTNVGFLYQFPNVFPGMMRVATPVGVFMAMVVIMSVMTCVIMAFVIIMGNMIGAAFQFHMGMCTDYPAPVFPDKLQFPAIKAEFGEPGPQHGGIDSQIHKRAQGHIPRNPGITIKM
jgi:hypothetical protein